MIKTIKNLVFDFRDRQRISIKLSKGSASFQSRRIDLKNPHSWEFSGFSQNGEDGIIDILRENMSSHDKYFIEIGSADGIDNNSSWLLFTQGYSGIMIDGNSNLIERAIRVVSSYGIGLRILNIFITVSSIIKLKNISKTLNPDLISLDIDGNDYFIAEELFLQGFRPKIFVVEYNSAFGSSDSITIKPDDNFQYLNQHSSGLYYGVSISGWKKLFNRYGYKFITVDSKGVNAFFVDPQYFNHDFLNNINPCDFRENESQLLKFGINSKEQFNIIKSMTFTNI
jgi:hypothetical protein